MNKDFKKYEIISLIFYAHALSWLFFTADISLIV